MRLPRSRPAPGATGTLTNTATDTAPIPADFPTADRLSVRPEIVLDEFRVLNSEGLRYDNEFVKHKVLDAIGDLYLLGHPLIGQYEIADERLAVRAEGLGCDPEQAARIGARAAGLAVGLLAVASVFYFLRAKLRST